VITIGIDPHKSSLTAVAVQPSGEVSATRLLRCVRSDHRSAGARRRTPRAGAQNSGPVNGVSSGWRSAVDRLKYSLE